MINSSDFGKTILCRWLEKSYEERFTKKTNPMQCD